MAEIELGMVVHALIPALGDRSRKISIGLRLAWSTQKVLGQTGLCRETCLKVRAKYV